MATETTTVVFEKNHREGFLVPLAETPATTADDIAAREQEYYRETGILSGAVQMPNDFFIKMYIASLSVIGLYVVFRMLGATHSRGD
jgi:hypothetical protein